MYEDEKELRRNLAKTITPEEFNVQLALGTLDTFTIVMWTSSLLILRRLVEHDNEVICAVALQRYNNLSNIDQPELTVKHD